MSENHEEIAGGYTGYKVLIVKIKADKRQIGVSMTTRNELHKLIDELNEAQLDNAKMAMVSIIQGNAIPKIPTCDLGSHEDIATLYETVVYDKKDKM